jgi:hypothetical protein
VKKLAVIPESPLAHHVVWCLAQESIRARLTSEMHLHDNAPRNAVIWIDDECDRDHAARIFRDACRDDTIACCPTCGYDLRGHSGQTACPECGTAVTATVGDITCEHCSERVPGSFEVCWNCGKPCT